LGAFFVEEIGVKIFNSLLFDPFFSDREKAPCLFLIFGFLAAVLPAIGQKASHLLFYLFGCCLLVLNDQLYQGSHQLIALSKALEFPHHALLHCLDLPYIECCILQLSLALLHELRNSL
jgi:hypothetical protein